MARTDKARFQAVLVETEDTMDRLFDRLGQDVGREIVAMAGPDGLIPPEKIQELMARTARHVHAAFIGPSGQPYGAGNKPASPYAELLTEGQMAMTDLALLRQATIVDRHLDEDLVLRMAERYRAESGR